MGAMKWALKKILGLIECIRVSGAVAGHDYGGF